MNQLPAEPTSAAFEFGLLTYDPFSFQGESLKGLDTVLEWGNSDPDQYG
jgi:hypothetical protein